MPIVHTSRRAARAIVWVLATGVAAAGLAVLAPGAMPAAAAGPGAVFQAVAPTRLADTRQPDCGCSVIDANTIRVQVLGRPGVPGGTTAAALSLTVSGTSAPGY